VRTSTPPEAPTPAVTSDTATKLQQLTVTPKGQITKTDVAADQISQTLQWSDGIIIASQPGYQAEGVVPHFSSAEERATTFRQARRNAVLFGDATSYETLARVYVDWGAGAKAIESLKHAGGTTGDADHLVTLAEGYRQMGRLDDAQQTLATTLDQYPDFAPARVALGNVFLDRARIAKEGKKYDDARRFLDLARDSYSRIVPAPSSSASPTLKQTKPPKDSHARIDRRGQQKPPPAPLNTLQTVAQSNLGQVYFALGDIAKNEKRLSDATSNFQSAEQAFKRADNPASQYPFGTKGLGDVYREMGNVSVMKGDVAGAGQLRLSAQQKYREALGAHSDFAEAYVGFGNLLEDAGQKDDALRAYLQATRVRPEQPDGFYYFAVVVADRNAQLAAAYSQAYLKSEKPTFRQGEKKENVDRINQGVPPIQRPAPVYVPPVAPPTGGVTDNTPTVKVPGVKGDKPDDALKKLKKVGLEARIEEQPECKATGKVLSTDPAKDSQAKVGQVVVLYVSGPGPDAVSVPNLVGMDRSRAEDELQRVNLRARISGTQPTRSYDPDTVVKQKPDGRGNRLMPRCEVELTLAVPIPQVRVPTYIGMNRQDAFRALPKYFGELVRGDVVDVDNGNAPPDTVVDQNPKPDTYVDRGSSVTLYITRGGGDTGTGGGGYNQVKPRVPDVRKRSLQIAVNDLKNANLGYDISGEQGDYVVDQYPAPGTLVDQGTRVHLKLVYSNVDRTGPGPGPYIYRQPAEEMVDVPNLYGKSFKDAVAALQPNLGYEIMSGDPNNPSSFVAKQNPTAGPKKARKGQKIQLWLTVVQE
jgi:beta-lactam-binding protein with PASTA domain/tetratricopeptide (TPR) repeat protein